MMTKNTQPAVPALRFEEFEGEWGKDKLRNVIKLISGQHLYSDEYTSDDTGTPYFTGPSDFTNDFDAVSKFSKTSKKVAKANDTLLTVKGSGCGRIMFLKLPVVSIGRQIMAIRAKNDDSRFIFHVLSRKKKRFERLSLGNMIPGLSRDDVLSTKINLPTLPEQQKIATFLTAVDRKIQQLRKKQDLLQQYKKGVMQRIFSQEMRFKREDGTEFKPWRVRKLSEAFNEHKLKSEGVEKVHSVSVHKGVINQIEHLGRSFAAKNTLHYNRVHFGDIVYTKSPTGSFPYGIIKQSRIKENAIVSPLYGVFTPETYALGYILNEYFTSTVNVHNYLHPIVQKGAKNTINITNKIFLSKSLKLPVSHEEQQKIATFLTQLDAKINGVAAQLAEMRAFKKGLLQQLFV